MRMVVVVVVYVCAWSCEYACMCAFAWVVDCVGFTGSGCFNVCLRVCVISDEGGG